MVGKKIERTFIPGSEWLYYKLYCGEKTADDILLNIINPLVIKLLEGDIIDKWFFIRYSDPESHLRIRFHLTEQKYLGDLILKVKEELLPLLNSNQIWDFQIATYKRELSRYGSSTIQIAESYFFYDSQDVLKIIEQSKGNNKQLFIKVFNLLTDLINSIEFEDVKRLNFLNERQLAFKNEFRIDGANKKILGQKYRKFLDDIENYKVEEKKILNSKEKFNCFYKYMSLQKQNHKEVNIEDVLGSFIHMTINRSFKSQQRLQEMIIYDFLYKNNRSRYAKN
ncbi:Nisin biosynthesis protein NisB [Polaribacter huanghezhanensis]|uniref:thiopeptide-type bacteriocin biosynthesis protein n=1 Tax=Polaribacter huanghezhanensis TaxID=1354726 RepID=UPI002648BA37|nr:thiopeptide-type bacteriocin biosynthesis protein [Polaribacter huanghezhanensis]WKD85073.1 Nisin biosynthesis protein NisB [Polaribacter huanghezhanensis]